MEQWRLLRNGCHRMTLAERLRIALRRGHAAEVILEKADVEGLRSEPGVPFAAAAVLIAVTDRPEPGLILTQRTTHLRKHAGQKIESASCRDRVCQYV